MKTCIHIKSCIQGVPGGSVVKNLPAQETRVRSLTQENLICLRATKACVSKLLSLWAAATEGCVPRACTQQQEKAPQWEACAPQLETSPLLTTIRESPHTATKTQQSQK